MTQYPVKSKKVKSRPLYYFAEAVTNQQGEYLLEQRDSTGLLANLWTFPLVEVSKEKYDAVKHSFVAYEESQQQQVVLDLVAEEELGLVDYLTDEIIWQKQPVGEITHVFSHLKWHVLIAYGREKEKAPVNLSAKQKWISPVDFANYPFPKPQQKMVQSLVKKNYL